MQTTISYYEDTYKFNSPANIIASNKDETGHFIILDNTIFHPQGGGQPSDIGKIEIGNEAIIISSVKWIGTEIRHYTDKDYLHLVEKQGLCLIDADKRKIHAKLHTSGHLISNVVENLYPDWKAVKGHHFPDQCYVEFAPKKGEISNVSIDLINTKIQQHIALNHPIYIDMQENHASTNQSIRVVRIGDFPFSPCGGTHVNSLIELTGLKVEKYKIKGTNLKISYNIHNQEESIP